MSRQAMSIAVLGLGLSLSGPVEVSLASPRQAPPGRWREIKCRRYKQAWADALARFGMRGLGQEFLGRHEAFVVSGCTGPADVCPRSDQELRLAKAMVVLAMNAGTASTFPPFKCPN